MTKNNYGFRRGMNPAMAVMMEKQRLRKKQLATEDDIGKVNMLISLYAIYKVWHINDKLERFINEYHSILDRVNDEGTEWLEKELKEKTDLYIITESEAEERGKNER